MPSSSGTAPPKKKPGTPNPTGAPGYNPMRWRRFWWVIGGLLLLNIVVSSIIQAASTPASVTIPYNVFLTQVDAGNVASITATGHKTMGQIAAATVRTRQANPNLTPR